MLLEELVAHYGSYAEMARELRIGSSTYLGWRRKGYIPWTTQCTIEKQTNRKFKANKKHAEPQK